MLPKNRRIERKFFNQIMRSDKRLNSPSFVLYITKINREKPGLPSRFAFSASKKISKRASDRNKLRRRGYSIISKNIGNITSGNFYFFSYKKALERDFSLLEKEILSLLSQYLVIR